jgi:hypothetical protein
MRRRDQDLSINDFKNISLWYDRVSTVCDDLTQSDKRTIIKIQALLIYEEEEAEEREDFGGRRFSGYFP